MAAAVLGELGITRENTKRLYEISYKELLGAYQAAVPALRRRGVNIGMAPLADDWFRGFPIDVGFCPWSKDKPLLLSSTIGEFNFKVNIPQEVKEELTEAGKLDMIRGRFGESADQLLELFRAAYPDHDILDLMYLDADFRRPTVETAKLHARASRYDNTFVYLFPYNMPQEHRIPAWHGADVGYALFNADKQPVGNEPIYGEQNRLALENAFLSFTVHGDPNNPYLPRWEPFTEEHRRTMVIDRKNELKEAYDEALITLYKKACPPLRFSPEA